jgi:hypothetical protein
MGTVSLLAIVVGVEFDVPRELLTMRGWRLTVEQALLYRIELCCGYLEAEIEYESSRFSSEIKHPRSQLEVYNKRTNGKEITNETSQ